MTALPRILGAAVVVIPCAVGLLAGLAGCRGGEREAPAAVGPATVAPAGSGPGAAARTDAGTAGDPLAGIEAQVDAVERDVEADALPSR
jgi:hypothetical protein